MATEGQGIPNASNTSKVRITRLSASPKFTKRVQRIRAAARRKRGGVVLYYMAGAMVAISGFCSMAVDYGRVQVAKAELRRAADAASRAAVAELPDANSAISFAAKYAQSNAVDGGTTSLNASQDIEFGFWDTKKTTFTVTGDLSKANCVHVTLRRTAQRGNAVPLLFAKVLGQNFCDVKAESYSMIIPPINVDQNVQGTANPFLAGAVPGTKASAVNPSSRKIPDVAGTTGDVKNSPTVVNVKLTDGDALTFDSIDGVVRHDPNLPYFDPDGEIGDIGHNNLTTTYANNYSSTYYNENGIADMKAPINTLVGIFLDDKDPSWSSAPKNLDFSTTASREFTELQPQIKQIFFIGDGKNSNGARQQFIVPQGATRLYLATWDFYEWNNNAGFRNIRVQRPGRIITVK